MKKYIYIVLMTVVLMWTGCESEDMNAPKQTVSIPLSIYLPADETNMMNLDGGPRKAMGDPGTTEQFALPNYVYIFVMKQEDESTWSVWNVITPEVTDGDWEMKRYAGSLQTVSDSIYEYKREISLLLKTGENFNGRVYAIASAVELSFNRALDKTGITSLSDLETLTFSAASSTVQRNLQHIYSSPYNYEKDGEYYGSFSTFTERVPQVNLMLYHVAAKVDIMWNVSEEMRIKANPAEAVRLTFMEVRHLFDDYAYCFKPMRNELAAIESEGYSIEDIVTESDEGLWWEGRYYFYTIPYVVTGAADAGKVYYPQQMVLKTNGSAGTGYQLTLNMQVDTSAVFVPWMRAMFNLTQPLANETDTKTVNLPTP